MDYTISNAYISVTAASQGAELQSILGADGTQYLWQGDPAYWAERSPVLFPWIGRLTEGCYRLDGELRRMRIHGIALYERFHCVERTDRRMAFELTDSPDTYESYPRHFSFRVEYALRDNTLEITYRVENRDEKPLYFGVGGHPGFRVPLDPGRAFTDYRLRFTDRTEALRVGFTESCFLNGQDRPYPLEQGTVIPLRHELFDQDAVVLKNMGREVTLEADGGHSVTVSYPQMPYLGIWHAPKTDAPYVCVEPWSSLPAWQDQIPVLEEDPNLIRLLPGETYSNLWTVTVR